MVSTIQKSLFILIALVGLSLCALTFLILHIPNTQFYQEIPPESTDGYSNYVLLDDTSIVQNISAQIVEFLKNSSALQVIAKNETKLPTIYLITATYTRPEQVPDMTRLSYTLMHVPSILWLVIEDAKELSPKVAEILQRANFPYIHLIAPAPPEAMYKNKTKARGVSNRNRGLQWLRENYVDPNGVIYFADDDNTYDLRLFDEIRSVKTFGAWPVGLIASTGLSSPVVRNGTVTGFYDGWPGGRRFPMDMAGFAFSVSLLLKSPNATMPFIPGYEEDRFIKSLKIEYKDIEPKADNCTKIYVWHTQSKKNKLPVRADATYNATNIKILYDYLLQGNPK